MMKVYARLFCITTLFFARCSKGPGDGDTTPPPPGPSVTTIDCNNRIISANPVEDSAYTGTVTVAYSGGNGAGYPAGAAIASTGVNGLTAKLNAGTLTSSNGTIVFAISGTPDTTGNAIFNISFGGQACSFSLPVYTAYGPVPVVNSINCGNWPNPPDFVHTVPYTGTWTVDVNAAFITSYGPGAPIQSVGVTGLTATLRAGTLNAPVSSTLVFDVTGTPSSVGTVQFPISFGGKSCTLTKSSVAPSTYCWQLSGVAKLACLSEEFTSLLTPAERAQTILPLTLANAQKWGWEPTDVFPRNGLRLKDIDETKANRAVALIKAVMGDTGYFYANEGYPEFNGIRKADGYLGLNVHSRYNKDHYAIAFLGTPSATGKWIIQIGGHHFAQQYLFDGGQLLGISPNFRGAEPMTLPSEPEQPLLDEVATARGLLMRLSPSQLIAAKLPGSMSELLMGTGSSPVTYPTIKQGVKVSTLSDTAKIWVRSILGLFYKDVDHPYINFFANRYLSEAEDIYVSYSGNASGVPGNASSFMNDPGDYIRLDGPTLWIEIMFVNGHAVPVKHAHAVFRDRSFDYLGL